MSEPVNPTTRSWQDIIASYRTYASAADVESTWRKHGWVPPSKECADTMRKQKAFREWSAQMGDTR